MNMDIPQDVIDVLETVNESGVVNLLNRVEVLEAIHKMPGQRHSEDWLFAHRNQWVEVLNSFRALGGLKKRKQPIHDEDDEWPDGSDNDLIGDQDAYGDDTPDRDDQNPGGY